MSSFKHPVGSQPSRVYWRRRATVIAVLLLVVVVIALFAAHAGSGSDAVSAPTASPTAASTPAPTPTVVAPASGATAAASAAPTAKASTGAAAGGASGSCTAGDITLKPVADKASYSSLEQPKIAMTITNTSSSACSIDLGSAQQVLTITSGTETYWSSKDCQVDGTHQTVKMTAGQTLTTPSITWDRTRSSSSTCDGTRSSVPAGGASYHLSVAVGSIKSTTPALMILN